MRKASSPPPPPQPKVIARCRCTTIILLLALGPMCIAISQSRTCGGCQNERAAAYEIDTVTVSLC